MWRVQTSRRTVITWRQGSTPLGYPVITPNGIASTNAFGVAQVSASYAATTTGRHRNWLLLCKRQSRAQVGRNGWVQVAGFATISPVGIASTNRFGNASVNPPLSNDQLRDLYLMMQELWRLRGLDKANPVHTSTLQTTAGSAITLTTGPDGSGAVVVQRA